jgi:hypothetical protein
VDRQQYPESPWGGQNNGSGWIMAEGRRSGPGQQEETLQGQRCLGTSLLMLGCRRGWILYTAPGMGPSIPKHWSICSHSFRGWDQRLIGTTACGGGGQQHPKGLSWDTQPLQSTAGPSRGRDAQRLIRGHCNRKCVPLLILPTPWCPSPRNQSPRSDPHTAPLTDGVPERRKAAA